MIGKSAALAALLLVSKAPDYPTDLVVHEWGTFTTIAASDGTLLNGLYLDEEPLPGFVNQMWPHYTEKKVSKNYGKGIYFQPVHVNVKMETPVIYFYSPRSLPVSVRVDFPRGLISQWYPQCTTLKSAEPQQQGDVYAVDFATPVNGFMEWQARVLAPDAPQKPTAETPSLVWNAPRLTDANLLAVTSAGKEQIEKFIFYRGVANFAPPITAKFTGASTNTTASTNTIEITNTGKEDLPFVFVYEKPDQGDAKVYWQGGIPKGQNHLVDRKPGQSKLNQSEPSQKMTFTTFEKALVDAGLYPREARAMLNTWKTSYFGRPGIRIFWIAPQSWVNSILPLKITPQPKETHRVFVGRYELLSPGFESALLRNWQENHGRLSPTTKAANDRYHLAYQDLLQHMNHARS